MDERGCWRQGRPKVDRDDPLRLQPALQPHRDAFDDRAFGHAPPAVLAKHAEVKQHVAFDVSLTRKPKPRVASNHFTRPVTARQLGAERAVFGLHYRLVASLGQLYASLTMGPINMCVSVGKPTLAQRSARARSASSSGSTSALPGQAR